MKEVNIMKNALTLENRVVGALSLAATLRFYLMLLVVPVAIWAVFFAPMGFLHDNLHHVRHSLTMVLCH